MTTHMTNDKGHLVPVEMVKPEHKLEDQLVAQLFGQATKLNAELTYFKAAAFDDIDAFLALLSEKYGLLKGGKKGNLTLQSYDGLSKVQVQVADGIAFGPELQIAKGLIDECIKAHSGGVNPTILTIVNHAFAVDKEGRVNRGNILGLRRLDIKDEQWTQAMQAINDSMRVVSTKQYVRFYRRTNLLSPWNSITLDFAAV